MGKGSSFGSITRLECQGDALLLKENDLVGLEKPKNELIEKLLASNSARVVSVVGMGGLGKSTLVKKVYDHPNVKKHFKFHAWITASQCFKTADLLKDMIQQCFCVLRKPAPQSMDNMYCDKLRTVINKFLKQRKYLIVLDDGWYTNAWDIFQHALPNNNCGSRILLTIRKNGIASKSCTEFPSNVYTMNLLSPEESWTLFCKITFQNNSCPPHLKNFSENIVGKCEGLPLAIVVISVVLATKDRSRIDEWGMVHLSLGDGLED